MVGIGLVVVGFCYAAVVFQRTMALAAPPVETEFRLASETTETVQPVETEPMDEAGLPPRYLAFVDENRSGRYRVADRPGSRDRDATAKVRVPDYPVETDLVPEESLHPAGTLTPGLYATPFGVRDCSYELQRVNRSGELTLIGSDRVSEGRMLVSINEIEPDVFHAQPQCGSWSRWSSLADPLVVAGNGDYWIGDLAAGVWSIPNGCRWESVVGFRGAELVDVVASGVGPTPMVIDEDTLGTRIRGCSQTLKYVGPATDE